MSAGDSLCPPWKSYSHRVRSGAFPGDRMPIVGTAAKVSELPRRTS